MAERVFDPNRHAPLEPFPWDSDRARDAIARIVLETRDAANADTLWPIHPEDGGASASTFYDLYSGAAGIVWALDLLTRTGFSADIFRPDIDITKWIAPNRGDGADVGRAGYDRLPCRTRPTHRRSLDRGGRDGLACRSLGEGKQPLSWDGREWVRLSQTVRPHRRRDLDLPRTRVCDARHSPKSEGSRNLWHAPPFALDRRCGSGLIPPSMCDGECSVPFAGCPLAAQTLL
jgi:hypothetical protein